MTSTANTKLPHKQERAIAELLQQPSVVAAAAAAGVGEKTIRRWLKRSDFRKAFQAAATEVLERAIGRLHKTTEAAVDVLNTSLESQSEAIRVRVALGVFDRVLRAKELLELEQRLSDLEKQLGKT